MSQSQVVEWYRRFRDGSRLLGDEKGPGRVYTYSFFLNASARQSILKMNDYYKQSTWTACLLGHLLRLKYTKENHFRLIRKLDRQYFDYNVVTNTFTFHTVFPPNTFFILLILHEHIPYFSFRDALIINY